MEDDQNEDNRPLRLLFVCGRNRLRSPTAEEVFAGDDVETLSAGVSPDADSPLDAESIEWADFVLFMEREHQTKAARQFGGAMRGKRCVCLNIPDQYQYMQPELINLLQTRVPRSVPGLRERFH
ncbi:MAG: hypothetical protein QM754_04810 [Tepidisphaeraceae bacterium]